MDTMNNKKRGTARSQPSRLPQPKFEMSRGILILAVLTAPSVALAEEPGPDATTLARAEALFAYCARIDAANGPKYREQLAVASQGARPDAIAKMRKSEEYQQVYKSVEDVVSLIDEANAMKVCNSALPRDN